MAQKIARLRIAREPGYLYFVKDSAVFATPIKGGKAKGSRKKVGTFDHVRDNAYMYFVDKDGDVARAMRQSGGKRKKAKATKALKVKAVRAPKAKAPKVKAVKSSKAKAVKAGIKRTLKATSKGERAQARESMMAVLRDMRGMGKRLR